MNHEAMIQELRARLAVRNDSPAFDAQKPGQAWLAAIRAEMVQVSSLSASRGEIQEHLLEVASLAIAGASSLATQEDHLASLADAFARALVQRHQLAAAG